MKLTKTQLTQMIKEELSDWYIRSTSSSGEPFPHEPRAVDPRPRDYTVPGHHSLPASGHSYSTSEGDCPRDADGNCLPIVTNNPMYAIYYRKRHHPSGRAVVYDPQKYSAEFPRGGPQPTLDMALKQDFYRRQKQSDDAFNRFNYPKQFAPKFGETVREENILKENDADVEWDAARANPGVTVRPAGDPWPGYEAQLAQLGANIATMGDIYDTFPIADWADLRWRHPSPSWEEALERARGQTDLQRREREYLENPPPWEHTAPSSYKRALWNAREAGETGWGPGSLEETIKKKLDTVLAEDYDINADPYLPSAGNYFLNPEAAGYNVSGLGYDTLFGPGTSEAAARQLSRRARTHYQDPWAAAIEAGSTGWGPGSLEEAIKEELINVLSEDGSRPAYSLSPDWATASQRDQLHTQDIVPDDMRIAAEYANWPQPDDLPYVDDEDALLRMHAWAPYLSALLGMPGDPRIAPARGGSIPDPAYGPGTPEEIERTGEAWGTAPDLPARSGVTLKPLEEAIKEKLKSALLELKNENN